VNQVFKLYVPGDSLPHRLGVGWKYLLMFVLVAVGVVFALWWLSLGLLAVAVGLVLLTRVRPGYALRLSWGIWLLVALLAIYQVAVGQYFLAIAVPANLVTAVYAARMLTISTPEGVLVDALISASRVLRPFGGNPEKIGLAVGIMMRSIPMLFDSFAAVRQAALARGRNRSPFAVVAPVVVRAVGFAQDTGAALAARGLGE
jgi:biotin transport system permease protein